MKTFHKAFTVLEFLVVIAIMCILIALILVGLTGARSNARDQARISNVQNIVVGLAQFHDICRVYPASLASTETCFELGGKTLGNILPDIDAYHVDPRYLYAGIADASDNTSCIGMHIGVKLENANSGFASSKAGFGPASYGQYLPQVLVACVPGADFEAGPTAPDPIFDIKK